MKVYLAGPMTGYKDFNFPAFEKAAAQLRAEGHEVFSPAEKDQELYGADVNKSETGAHADAAAKGFSLRQALSLDLQWICEEADAVAFLPGWERSAGANAEHRTAIALIPEGMQIIYLT